MSHITLIGEQDDEEEPADVRGGGGEGAGSGGGKGGDGGEGADWEGMLHEGRARLKKKKEEREEAERIYYHLCQEEVELEQEIESLKKRRKKASSKKDWGGTFEWSQRVTSTLETTFKLPGFRPKQLEIINAALSGRDTLVLLPTGGGKSLVYQLPACVQAGFCLVVSPLIALMHDQVSQLKRSGVKAELLFRDTDKEDSKRIHGMMTEAAGGLKLLYVTPERVVKSKMLMSRLEKAAGAGLLSRIVVDEAHCISSWGHDYRPDYLKLKILREQLPRVPVMALTATATHEVQSHILQNMKIDEDDCDVFRASVDRANLQYEVSIKPDDAEAEVLNVINDRFEGETGIVYCFSQKETEKLTQRLREGGIRAGCYHAGAEFGGAGGRQEVHDDWMAGRIHVVVATIAFGMGINKEDVRFVIHHTMSKSPSAYYQEAGRAGRDGKAATCILYYKPYDIVRQSQLVAGNAEQEEYVPKMYQLVRYCEEMLMMRDGPKADMHLLGRQLIGQHFHEHLNLIDRRGAEEGTDMAHDCGVVHRILDCKSSRGGEGNDTTLLQLAKLWKGSGRKAEYGIPEDKAPYSLSECERRLVLMLEARALAQYFKYTAYCVNAYVRKGSRLKSDKVVACVRLAEGASKPPARGAGAAKKRKASAKPKKGGGGGGEDDDSDFEPLLRKKGKSGE